MWVVGAWAWMWWWWCARGSGGTLTWLQERVPARDVVEMEVGVQHHTVHHRRVNRTVHELVPRVPAQRPRQTITNDYKRLQTITNEHTQTSTNEHKRLQTSTNEHTQTFTRQTPWLVLTSARTAQARQHRQHRQHRHSTVSTSEGADADADTPTVGGSVLVRRGVRRHREHLLRKRAGGVFFSRVGIFLHFVRLTARTVHPHGAHVRGAKRNRIDRHWGEIERLTTRTRALGKA